MFGFRLSSSFVDIVIGQGYVEGVKFGGEILRVVTDSTSGGVIASIVILPLGVPAALIIGDGVFFAGFFSNPKDGGKYISFPLGEIATWRVISL